MSESKDILGPGQTTLDCQLISATRVMNDILDSDTSLFYNLVRESSGESDDSSLGRGVIEELGISTDT
jgi:hypothetical protein